VKPSSEEKSEKAAGAEEKAVTPKVETPAPSAPAPDAPVDKPAEPPAKPKRGWWQRRLSGE